MDKDLIINKVQKVLNKRFDINSKQYINIFENRLNFACPYCGDSYNNTQRKRGNIYLNNMMFHCYNAGCNTHKDFIGFLKDFDEKLDSLDDLVTVLDYIKENKYKLQDKDYLTFEIFKLLSDYSIERNYIKKRFGLIEITENEDILKYIKDRLIPKNKYRHFLYDWRKEQLYILNLDFYNNIIGYQIRNMKKNKQLKNNKYISYNIEKINKMLLSRNLNKLIQSDVLYKLNSMSIYYNIFNLDFTKTYTIFEGPIDSFFMSNSTSSSGVFKSSEFIETNNSRYLYDNDDVGKNKAIEKIKENKNVFLWTKLITDYKLDKTLIKDYNDLIKQLYKNKNIEPIKNIDKYFSNNPLDIIYI